MQKFGFELPNTEQALGSFWDADFDNNYDTMEDDDYINIGVFPPSEDLHHVATYDKSANKYDIDHEELRISVLGFTDIDD